MKRKGRVEKSEKKEDGGIMRVQRRWGDGRSGFEGNGGKGMSEGVGEVQISPLLYQ